MGTFDVNGHEYWRRVLGAGEFAVVPRWTHDPRPGTAEHVLPVADDLAAALTGAELLAAHARVLAALTGEQEVGTTCVVTPGGQALPCRLATDVSTWRELVRRARRVQSEMSAHEGFPGATPGETVLDPTGGEPVDTALWVGVVRHDGRAALRLRYRTDVLDAEAARRIGAYHLTALALIVGDPDGEPGRACLLSADELRFQMDGLAGPERPLPDRRFHELFEERVRLHPDAVAAVRGDRRWTYRELNARANRLARALRARGLGREGVVAVATERNLDWMAAVIAVFKAGGVYLPIEPHLPPARIARVLTRAACHLVLTEPASRGSLDDLPGVQRLLVDDAYGEGHADGDLHVPVAPDQLAYIYFTSGSTGEPKGAMCEHAGMLNHLLAKITDLEIAEGDVVAQTAPQSFDISLWQLVSALLVGGRTQLVEQAAILDVPRFVDTVVGGGVGVLQLVPSYLEVVLTYLDQHPRALPDLHCVSVTGEALKKELAERWFAAHPGIMLVNAYGLTETSDDTNHEVMRAAPEGDRVPLGPPVPNVRVYVVDEHLNPVPLGAPGAIVFSGVCVGRGYVNDPERTAAAYRSDPHRPGERLYLAGDYGRWRPDGKLEFLGRKDSQVKISGFRIEIGEIENTLLAVPGVRDGAVVVRDKQLVAFYAGPRALPTEVLRERLGATLPGYMVPTVFHRQDALPLTPNSKIDKKALTVLAAELAVAEERVELPGTPTERRLAGAWASVLGVAPAEIGRTDHFFDRGGDSLTAVRMAVALERAVSLKDIARHPVLADLAALVDERADNRADNRKDATR